MADTTFNVLSLCSGVGGLDLGTRLAVPNSRTVCFVEREVAACASLAASMDAGWFHKAPIWMGDIAEFDGKPWRGMVDCVASSDPCQPNSVAGKGLGADDERFLADQVIRIVSECRPRYFWRENVPGNTDGQLEAIVPPLEGMGYRVAAGIFSSSETGNTMRRERLFIMAERMDGTPSARCDASRFGADTHGEGGECVPSSGCDELARPQSKRRGKAGRDSGRPEEWTGGGRRTQGHAAKPSKQSHQAGAQLPPAVIPGPTDSRWIDVLDRWPELQPALSEEEAQSHLRRGVDAMAHRIERLRATGNGVDPLVAAYAFLSLGALLAETR